MKYLKYLSVIFIFSFCSEQVVEPKRIRHEDDYAIYEKLFEEFVPDQNEIIVLSDSTYGESSVYINPEYFVSGLEGLSAETLQNYMSVNRQRIKLKKIPNIDFVFTSEYDNSSDHKVHITVSRVGYNKQKTQAVVTIGVVYQPLAGAGAMILLVKDGYKWKIQSTMMTWIS